MASKPFPELVVAVGEEGSDPVVTHEGRDHRVDEYALSGHLGRMDGDLGDVADLGVEVLRYGMPWRLTELEPGRYDWSLWDEALAACERHGLEPVVDLLHFGLPDHYPGFCDASFVEGFCRYVDAFLARYRDVSWFTPVNEPGVHAVLSARLGIWNDRKADEPSHAAALANVVLANLEAIARIRDDRDGWWIGSEGFSCYVGVDDDAQREADLARSEDWLVWDLHLGVEPEGPAAALAEHIEPATRARIDALAVRDGRHVVAGHDLYPAGYRRFGSVDLVTATPVEIAAAYGTEARRWFERYGVPAWVAETSNLGLDVSQQVPWLEALSAQVEALNASGTPSRGICWYSRGDQFDWHTALAVPVGEITEVGLFAQDRAARPSAAAIKQLAERWAKLP